MLSSVYLLVLGINIYISISFTTRHVLLVFYQSSYFQLNPGRLCVCMCVCVCVEGGGRGAGGGGRRDEKIKICLRKLGVNKVHSGRMFYLYFDLISFSSLAFHYFLQDDLLI